MKANFAAMASGIISDHSIWNFRWKRIYVIIQSVIITDHVLVISTVLNFCSFPQRQYHIVTTSGHKLNPNRQAGSPLVCAARTAIQARLSSVILLRSSSGDYTMIKRHVELGKLQLS